MEGSDCLFQGGGRQRSRKQAKKSTPSHVHLSLVWEFLSFMSQKGVFWVKHSPSFG